MLPPVIDFSQRIGSFEESIAEEKGKSRETTPVPSNEASRETGREKEEEEFLFPTPESERSRSRPSSPLRSNTSPALDRNFSPPPTSLPPRLLPNVLVGKTALMLPFKVPLRLFPFSPPFPYL